MDTLQSLSNRFNTEWLAMFLLHSLWIGAVICAMAWLSLVVFRSAAARTRCNLLLVWLFTIPIASLLACVNWQPANSQSTDKLRAGIPTSQAMPSSDMASLVPTSQVAASLDRELPSISDGNFEPVDAALELTQAVISDVPTGAPTTTAKATHGTEVPSHSVDWGGIQGCLVSIVVWVWLLGVAFQWLRMLADWLQIRRWLRSSSAAESRLMERIDALQTKLNMYQRVQLRIVPNINVPMALGVLRPMILLPVSCLTQLTPMELETILVHELVHIRRLDCLLHGAQRIVETLLFFHPGVWWIGYQIRQEREYDCDDNVVRLTENRLSYARALASIATSVELRPVVVSASSGFLKARIQRIVGRAHGSALPPVPLAGIAGSVACVVWMIWSFLPMSPASGSADALQQSASVEPTQFPQLPANSSNAAATNNANEIAGVVLDPNKKPAAGVTVVVRPRQADTEDLATTTTDASGRFAFDKKTIVQAMAGRARTMWDVVARKPGSCIRWQLLGNSTNDDIKLQQLKPARFTGRVVNEAGQPIAGAAVRVLKIMSLNTLTTTDDFERSGSYTLGKSYLDLSNGLHLEAISDANGLFTLDELPPRVGLQLTVDDQRVQHQVFYAATTAEPLSSRARYTDSTTNTYLPIEILRDGATLKLERAVHLQLVFTDELSGKPIQGVKANGLVGGRLGTNNDEFPPSDEDGVVNFYRISPTALRGAQIVVSPPDGSTYLGGLLINQRLPSSDFVVRHEVRLCKGIDLLGRVVDEQDGTGVAKSYVGYLPTLNQIADELLYFFHVRPVVSQSDGSFHMQLPDPSRFGGTLQLLTTPAGYEDTPDQRMYDIPTLGASVAYAGSHSNGDNPPYQIQLSKPGEGRPPEFRIKRRPPVLFRFVDRENNPLAVNVTAHTFISTPAIARLPGLFFSIEPQFPDTQPQLPSTSSGQNSFEVSEYQVASGEPFNAAALLRQSSRRSTTPPLVSLDQQSYPAASRQPAGLLLQVVSTDQRYGAFYSVGNLQSSAAETKLTLEPLGSISGVVSSSRDGLPIARASVQLMVILHPANGMHLLHSVKTDDRGHFSFERLIPNIQYQVVVDFDSMHNQRSRSMQVNLRPDEHVRLDSNAMLVPAGWTLE